MFDLFTVFSVYIDETKTNALPCWGKSSKSSHWFLFYSKHVFYLATTVTVVHHVNTMIPALNKGKNAIKLILETTTLVTCCMVTSDRLHCCFLGRDLRLWCPVCGYLLPLEFKLHLSSVMKMEKGCTKHLILERNLSFITAHSNSHRSNYLIFFSNTTVCPVLFSQIDHYAQRDLKKGLQLFGTEGNVGLTNAWMIVQTDVRTHWTSIDTYNTKPSSFKTFFFLSVTVCWSHDALKTLQPIQY